ncbi:MAG: SPFH domain-containing protein [Saprospiraceae bacterium]
MKPQQFYYLFFLIFMSFIFSNCENKKLPSQDFVHQNFLSDVRLGDGVPLQLTVSIRWKLEDVQNFYNQFVTMDSFNQVILKPRSMELVKNLSNEFSSVDSVFSSARQLYINSIKDELLAKLGEPGIVINEIILSDITFPASYTKAMEEVGLQRKEIERIRQMNIVELERATANKKKAEADGEVQIAQAEAQGKLQKIQAETEKQRRKIELAKAETAKQVQKMQAQAQAEKLKLIAKAELEKKRDLKNLDIQKQKDLEQIQIDKQRQMDKVAFEQQIDLARLCAENPTFATFLINKELAGKVEIAVLPTGSNPSVFNGLLNQNNQIKNINN